MMAKIILIFILAMVPLAQEYQIPKDTNVAYKESIQQSPPPPPLPPPQQQHSLSLRDPPIPTSLSYYQGSHQQIDPCARDEVLVNGACHRLLTRGPCALDEYVLLDPADDAGFCAARLCAPDRIFVFSDQLCHDPLNTELCPPGRQLYQTAYGTPICQCPDGTYEADDDLDKDVCKPLLSHDPTCLSSSQVLWFKDFSSSPECLPDPCGGKNLRRGSDYLPFVPSAQDGKCYQLGRGIGVCPAKTWYSLALHTLRGVCVGLDDAGYQVFDEATLEYLIQQYGAFTRDIVALSPTPATEVVVDHVTSKASTLDPSPSSAQGSGQDPMLTQSPVPGFSPGSTKDILGPERANSENPERFVGKTGDSGRAGPTNDQTKASMSGQGTVGHSGLFGATLQHGEAFQTSPGQGVSRPLNGTLKEGSQRDRQSPTTSTTSQTSPTPPIQYSHPSEDPSQSSLSYLPDYYPHYSQKPSSHSLPTHYFNPNQQGSPTLPDPPSSSFSTSQTPPSSAHYSYPAVHHQTSFPQVSPTPFSGPDQSHASLIHLQTSEPSMLRNQSSPSNSDRESSALSPHLSHLLPHPPALPPGHLVLGSLEHQQPSLEVYETYDSSVREELDFSRLANVPLRGSSSAIDSPPVTYGHQDFFSGAVPTRGQQHIKPHQHQYQRHYSHQHQGGQHQQQLRGRRSALPHASPGNVIEPLLAACRAGAQRDVNAKCRDTVLPAATVLKREVRAAPPVPPRPTCPEGQAYGRNRSCMSGSEAINSINAFNLGK